MNIQKCELFLGSSVLIAKIIVLISIKQGQGSFAFTHPLQTSKKILVFHKQASILLKFSKIVAGAKQYIGRQIKERTTRWYEGQRRFCNVLKVIIGMQNA